MKESSKQWVEFICRWISDRPWHALALALTLLLSSAYGLLKVETDYSVDIWFEKDNQLLENYQFSTTTFGTDHVFIIVLTPPTKLFHQQSLTDIQELTETFWKIKNIKRVDSLNNFQVVGGVDNQIEVRDFYNQVTSVNLEELRKKAQEHPSLKGLFLSHDEKVTLFLLHYHNPVDEKADFKAPSSSIEEVLLPYIEKGYTFHHLGTARVTNSFREIAERELFLLIPLACLLIFLLLWFIFRQKILIIAPFVVIGLTVLTTLGISGLFAIKINNLSGMVPIILMAIALADSIHLLRSFMGKKQELWQILSKNWAPTLLTTITTAFGFFSLVANDLVPIIDFGMMCGLGSMLAWIYTYLVIIPLIKIFPPRETKPSFKFNNALWAKKITNIINDRYRSIIIFFLMSMGISTYFALQNKVNSNPFDYFHPSHPLSIGNQYIKDKFTGLNGLDLVIDTGAEYNFHEPSFWKRLYDFDLWVKELPYINTTFSILNEMTEIVAVTSPERSIPLPLSREESAQLYLLYSLSLPEGLDLTNRVDIKERYIKYRILWNIQDSTECIAEAKRIVAKANELGLKSYPTGQEYLFQRMNDYVVLGYFKSLAISLCLISLVMLLYFQSFKFAIISLLPNLIPISIGAMMMYWQNRPIDAGTVLVSSVCFGIAIDDTIHFLIHFRRNRKSSDNFQIALEQTLNDTGVALFITTLILVVGFSIFFFAEFVPNYNFGVFSAKVLAIALLVDLIFLPALLRLGERSS